MRGYFLTSSSFKNRNHRPDVKLYKTLHLPKDDSLNYTIFTWQLCNKWSRPSAFFFFPLFHYFVPSCSILLSSYSMPTPPPPPLPPPRLPVYTVFVRAQNSHLSLLGSFSFSLLHSSLLLLLCVFRAGKASSSCMQRGACSCLRLSHKGPRSVMLQSSRPQGSSFHLPPFSLFLSSAALFSLPPQDFNALVFLSASICLIPFSLTYFLNLFI